MKVTISQTLTTAPSLETGDNRLCENHGKRALAKHEKIEQTLDGLSDSEVMAKLGHAGEFPEGRFFPDTYRFVRGMTDAQLLEKAYNRLEKVLAEEWQQRAPDLPYANPYQALIMASLVEKETGAARGRRAGAGFLCGHLLGDVIWCKCRS